MSTVGDAYKDVTVYRTHAAIHWEADINGWSSTSLPPEPAARLQFIDWPDDMVAGDAWFTWVVDTRDLPTRQGA